MLTPRAAGLVEAYDGVAPADHSAEALRLVLVAALLLAAVGRGAGLAAGT